MQSLPDEAIILILQKSVLETILSDVKFQKVGTPAALIKSILSIITTDNPKTYFFWRTSFKEKQFLYMLYQTVFHNTPELNQFLASTSLDDKREYGLKTAKELESNIELNSSSNELTVYLGKIELSLAKYQNAPSGHW